MLQVLEWVSRHPSDAFSVSLFVMALTYLIMMGIQGIIRAWNESRHKRSVDDPALFMSDRGGQCPRSDCPISFRRIRGNVRVDRRGDLESINEMGPATWTRERPVIPGWYWFEPFDDDSRTMLKVDFVNGELRAYGLEYYDSPLYEIDGRWSDRPIDEPRSDEPH